MVASISSSGPTYCQCLTAVPIGGVGPYTALWSTGENTGTICPGFPGVVELLITDANGCIDDTFVTMGGGPPPELTVSSTPALCRNGTATASVTGGTPPYQFLWSTVPPQTDSVATGLFANQYYTVTVSDDSGCVQNAYVNIMTTSNLSSGINSTPDTCSHGVGNITGYAISGIPPYSYHWNTGDTITTLIDLNAGSYSFTVTDDSGCVDTSGVNLINFSPVQATTTEVNPSCTGADGSITLSVAGGTPSYNYFWNTIPPQSTNVASNLGVGLYHCLITDQQGCEADVSVNLIDNSTFLLSSYAAADTCGHGVGVAIATPVNGVPPYSYQWNNLASSPDSVLLNRYQGWNTCYVTDDSGWRPKAAFNFIRPFVVNFTECSCPFTADGSAAANVIGGTPPISYVWTNGSTGSTVNGLLQGHYSVYVTDSMGCSANYQYIVGYDSISPCAVIPARTGRHRLHGTDGRRPRGAHEERAAAAADPARDHRASSC